MLSFCLDKKRSMPLHSKIAYWHRQDTSNAVYCSYAISVYQPLHLNYSSWIFQKIQYPPFHQWPNVVGWDTTPFAKGQKEANPEHWFTCPPTQRMDRTGLGSSKCLDAAPHGRTRSNDFILKRQCHLKQTHPHAFVPC